MQATLGSSLLHAALGSTDGTQTIETPLSGTGINLFRKFLTMASCLWLAINIAYDQRKLTCATRLSSPLPMTSTISHSFVSSLVYFKQGM